jgi:hypothetical protein
VKPIRNSVLISALGVLMLAGLPFLAAAQKDNQSKQPPAPSLTRTTPRHETYRLGFAGTVSIVGPPTGSITVEGWQRNEVDVTAQIELHAPDASGLDQLAAVNNFFVQADIDHIRILTTGTHDREFMKKSAKNFPKTLIGLPWKIDYHIKIPAVSDLEIDAGIGPINLAGVEGTIRLSALQSNANLSLTGGLVFATIQNGNVGVSIPSRGWHGLGAEIRLASGSLSVGLAPGYNGEINAEVLRNGEITIGVPNLEPIERNSITPRAVLARAGTGGARITLTVGDGRIEIKEGVRGKQ